MVRTCPRCDTRTMVRRVTEGSVFFDCACGYRERGEIRDALIESSRGEADSSKHRTFIEASPYMRTTLRVPVPCEGCGLPYMTQARVGDEETIVFTCACGAQRAAIDTQLSK